MDPDAIDRVVGKYSAARLGSIAATRRTRCAPPSSPQRSENGAQLEDVQKARSAPGRINPYLGGQCRRAFFPDLCAFPQVAFARLQLDADLTERREPG